MKILLKTLVVIMIFLSSSYSVHAKSKDVNKEVHISIETAKSLALKDHVNLKLLEARMKAYNSQLAHLNDQKEDLSTYQRMPGGSLPTSYDDFLKEYPDFEELTEEEQQEIHQIIITQIMINTTLNQYISSQAIQYNHSMEEQLKQQREQLNSAILTAESEKRANVLEKEKTKELISYYIVQKYISILTLENDLERLNLERETILTNLDDSQFLLEFGLITSNEVNSIKDGLKQKEQEIDSLTIAYQYYLKEFAIELGIPLDQTIVLEPLDIDVKQLPLSKLEDELKKNLDVKMLDEQIQLARNNYNSTSSSQSDLRVYYSHILDSKILEREILLIDLKKKLRGYEKEQEDLFLNITSLEQEQERLRGEVEDAQIKFSVGIITKKELESYVTELRKVEKSIKRIYLEFALFSEKVSQVGKGVVH